MNIDERYDLRPLTQADAEQIAPLHVRIWRETYGGLMSQEALDTLDVGQRVAMWQRWLSDTASPTATGAFVRATKELVGWITVGPARDDDAPCERELWVLNVVSEHQGSGLANAMLARDLPPGQPAYLWVVEGNERAVAFYAKHGFAVDGAWRTEEEGNRDLRMTRAGILL